MCVCVSLAGCLEGNKRVYESTANLRCFALFPHFVAQKNMSSGKLFHEPLSKTHGKSVNISYLVGSTTPQTAPPPALPPSQCSGIPDDWLLTWLIDQGPEITHLNMGAFLPYTVYTLEDENLVLSQSCQALLACQCMLDAQVRKQNPSP